MQLQDKLAESEDEEAGFFDLVDLAAAVDSVDNVAPLQQAIQPLSRAEQLLREPPVITCDNLLFGENGTYAQTYAQMHCSRQAVM